VGAGGITGWFWLQCFSDKELVAAGADPRGRYLPGVRFCARRDPEISFDLIAGFAEQTKESWRMSLIELVAGAGDVSVYLLEIDEGSRLGKELLLGGAKYSAGAVPSEDECDY